MELQAQLAESTLLAEGWAGQTQSKSKPKQIQPPQEINPQKIKPKPNQNQVTELQGQLAESTLLAEGRAGRAGSGEEALFPEAGPSKSGL